MEDSSSKKNDSFGGKTVGTAGGGVFLVVCNSLIQTPQVKEIAIYAAPFVAVWCKEWGGFAAYNARVWFVQIVQEFKLKGLKKKIDGLPDHPQTEHLKKEVSDKYYKVSADLIHAGLDDVGRLGKFSAEKESKKGG